MASPLTYDDPERLGPYTLVARLGGGGMGTVYLGRSRGGRTVALKTMHAPLAGQTEFRTRFRLEVDAARVIGDRYGAQVVDADPLAATPWLATEYVLGPPLDDAVTLCGPLPETTVCALGGELAAALAQLHRSDVVHRDLKPSNILLTATGPKVIDFGIARAVGDDRLTRTGAAAGTPAFMSPEQATAREHTPAGDVFALAGVLVFAATGRAPFGGGQAADLIYRVRYADPDLTAVPDGLRPILARCLAKGPAERPDTEELQRLLDGRSGAEADGAHFADRLPATVLADIARRSAAVWDVRPARRSAPDPVADDTAGYPLRSEQNGTGRAPRGRLSRRRLIGAGGGVLAAVAAGGGALAWFRDDPPTSAPAAASPSGRSPGTPPSAEWRASVGLLSTEVSTYVVGDSVAIVGATGLRWVDARTGDKGATNDRVTDAMSLISDGKRLFTVEEGEGGGDAEEKSDPRITPVDVATGSFRSPLAHIKGIEADTGRLIAVTDDLIVVQGRAGKRRPRIAYDKHTGEERWRRPVDRREGIPDDSVDEVRHVVVTPIGRRLVVSSPRRLTAVALDDGKLLWTRALDRLQGEGLISARQHVHTDTHLFLHGADVRAVRLSDGRTDWSFGEGRKATSEHSADTAIYGSSVVKDGVLHCPERGTGVIALDAATGKLRWEQKKGAGPDPDIGTRTAIGTRYLYVKPEGGQWTMAIDLRTHRFAWTFQGPTDSDYSVYLTPLRDTELMLVSSGTTVCAIPLE